VYFVLGSAKTFRYSDLEAVLDGDYDLI
jgi:hypothetical protein